MPNVKQIKAGGALQILRVSADGTVLEVEPGLTIANGGALQTTGVGTGAISGNARGAGATDLQNVRSAATGIASGINSFCCGQFNTASGRGSAAFGSGNNAAQDFSMVVGNSGQSRYPGSLVISSGAFSYADAQAHQYVLRATTTNATSTELTSPARLVIPSARASYFLVWVTARDVSTGQSAAYKIEGLFKRPGAANTIANPGGTFKTV